MELLIKILSKFSKYELLNNLLPGVALSYLLWKIGYPVWGDNTLINIIVAYYVGMICSRFSSLCIEEPFRKWKVIEWRGYDLYSKAKKERPFVSLLQESANMYRNLAGAFILSLVAFGYAKLSECWPFLAKNHLFILILLLALLYLFSYRKQINDYVVKNIDEVNK